MKSNNQTILRIFYTEEFSNLFEGNLGQTLENQIFPRHVVFIKSEKTISIFTFRKKSAHQGFRFLSKSQKPHFWAFLELFTSWSSHHDFYPYTKKATLWLNSVLNAQTQSQSMYL